MTIRQGLCGILAISLVFLYSCGGNSNQSQRFVESEALSKPTLNVVLSDSEKYSFAAVGDLHVAGADLRRLKRILDAASSEGDSFIVLLGDIVDAGIRSDMEAVKEALTERGWLDKTLFVIGNHDVFEAGWGNYSAVFGPSHYVQTIGNAKFIALDTADGALCLPEREWLERELRASTETHRFILSHYLPHIPDTRTYLRFANEVEAVGLMKLASRFGVSGWLGGHYHSYLLGVVDRVSYLVAGGGGGRRMPPVDRNFYARVQVDHATVQYEMKAVE